MLEKYHFIGIGGIGMSGLARLLLNQKIVVSGSDLKSNEVTDALAKDGAKIYIGHNAENVESSMKVIYSTDIKKENVEYQAAINLRCPLIHRSELLKHLMDNTQSLAVTGTHGKTTTSSLLTWVLESSGCSPSYAIGGIVPQLASNAGQGNGNYFIAEACESDGSFLNYHPFGAIVTNIDLDHMDHYGTENELMNAFQSFMKHVSSFDHLFWCGDDERLRALTPPGISYGFGGRCELRGENFSQKGWMTFVDIVFNGKTFAQVELSLIGRHNVLNAIAVFGMALNLGIDEGEIRKAFRSFKGVLRRCEKKGERHGILFLDDYAHHPTEIQTTLAAIKQAIGARRLVVAYQPHRYSRAKTCMGMYHQVFNVVDALFVSEIYGAREQPIPGVVAEKIVEEIQKDLGERCHYVERQKMAETLSRFLRPHDVLVTMGAGDITKAGEEIIEKLCLQGPPKLKLGIVFGGMSVEHDVSLLSVDNILEGIRSDYYEIEQFGISREGGWITGAYSRPLLKKREAVQQFTHEILVKVLNCDILFPVLHGTGGEDGTIQGLFEMFAKAYVGCDHRSAAVCMDKGLTKQIVRDCGIPILPMISFKGWEWERNREALVQRIHQELRYPLFVKPAHLGSSIGVHKATDERELCEAIADALRFDTHILVENGIENVREIEFALLGNHEIQIFPPGEVYAAGNLHDYDSKYGQNPNKPAAEFAAKANLPTEKIKEGMELAKKAYQAVSCMGMARVDTFLDPDGNYWFNEINPIPGFTKYSLYPIMCMANGISMAELIDQLIILGLERRRQLDRLELYHDASF